MSTKSGIIERENAKEGARDWQLTRVRTQPAKGGRPGEAYRLALDRGLLFETVRRRGRRRSSFSISTNPPARCLIIEVFRSGCYGGRGARLMTTLGPFAGTTQPDPPVGIPAIAGVPLGSEREADRSAGLAERRLPAAG